MSGKELPKEYQEALAIASALVRGKFQPEEVDIVDIYDLGIDKNDGSPVQSVEVRGCEWLTKQDAERFPNPNSVVKIAFKGIRTIQAIFGEIEQQEDGSIRFSNLTYDSNTGRPTKMKVPRLPAEKYSDKTSSFWYQIGQK